MGSRFVYFSYMLGGGVISSEPGFLRKVKKPTATGTNIIKKDRHTSAMPTEGDRLESLNVPLPVAVIAPKRQINKPGHPHNTTVAIVAIIPVFLLFILFLLFEFTPLYQQVSTSQFCTDFMLQPLYDLRADRRGFGVGHCFLGLIGEIVR